MMSNNRVSVSGSERAPLPGSTMVGAADPKERISVTVLVRRRTSHEILRSKIEEMATRRPAERKDLSREEFAAAYGATPEDLEKVKHFARDHKLDVVSVSAGERRVVLSGTVAAFCAAFGVNLARYEHPNGTYRGREGPVQVPKDLAPIIEGVFGLDNRPQARYHLRVLNNRSGVAQPRIGGISYTPPELSRLYDFPQGMNGSGQCLGIIELGGGFRATDLKTFFSKLGIPRPKVKSVSIGSGHNKPTGDPNGPDGEVLLDIEVAGAIAPGAKIVVYFAPNSDAGFLDAVTHAIHDTQNKPSVLSISWGGAESTWTQQAMQAMDSAFRDAAALGVTICCAAGDDGSSDLRPPEHDDGLLHVDFPASSPYALACGGTKLEGTASTITSEVVWNEGRNGGSTGGGVSEVFALPSWQANASVPKSANPGEHIGRGLPDIAGNADPSTGYQVYVDGQSATFGGTSAVAPLWAGLIALLNQKLGHAVGYLNPLLYSLPTSAGAFHDIITGDNDINGHNGAYHAGPGWDACTGWGSPDGNKLLGAL